MPIEITKDIKLNYFSKEYNSINKKKSLELNGHALMIRDNISDLKPFLIFDIKEVMLVSAVKGLPSKSPNFNVYMIAVISRFHQNLVIKKKKKKKINVQKRLPKKKLDRFFSSSLKKKKIETMCCLLSI